MTKADRASAERLEWHLRDTALNATGHSLAVVFQNNCDFYSRFVPGDYKFPWEKSLNTTSGTTIDNVDFQTFIFQWPQSYPARFRTQTANAWPELKSRRCGADFPLGPGPTKTKHLVFSSERQDATLSRHPELLPPADSDCKCFGFGPRSQ
jgi:hypothetical protein